jgi:hypothetical protein
LSVLALAALVALPGCGGKPTGTVSGQVIYKDREGKETVLKGGTVVFTTADKTAYRGDITAEGRYTIDKVPPGLVAVTVSTQQLALAIDRPRPNRPTGAPNAGADPEELRKRYTEIPEKYGNAATSGLTYTVTKGKQDHNITFGPD